LGEIEQTLAGNAAVQSCAVLAREDDPGNKQLVAYVIPARTVSASARDLQDFLKQRLPEFMVPAQFVFLDAFPLTQNGKVDRKALPAPTRDEVPAGRAFVAPRTDTEKTLAGIWAPLLNLERIGVHDDVFDLGANSLVGMRAVTQIRRVFDVNVQLRNLFERPTVAGLAETIERLSLFACPAAASREAGEREEITL
jgi:hypothetical protein